MTYWSVYVLGERVADFATLRQAVAVVREWRLAFGPRFDVYAQEFYGRGSGR